MGFNSGFKGLKDCHILDYNTVQSSRWLPEFQKNLLPLYLSKLLISIYQTTWFHISEDSDSDL